MAQEDWYTGTAEDARKEEANPRRPEGALGREMLARMNESHAALVAWGLGQLHFAPGDTIIDIGCGGGNMLARMAEHVTEGHLVGIDYAEASVETSRAFNAQLIDAGRMEVLHGSVEDLPFSDGIFDKAVTVESFYFWPNPAENLKEVARILRPGGTFLLLAEIYGKEGLSAHVRESVVKYDLFNPTPEEFRQLFSDAGFREVHLHFADGKDWIAVLGER